MISTEKMVRVCVGLYIYIQHELAEREGGKQSKGKEQIKGK